MKPYYLPQLVNDAFGDPVLFVDFLYEHRAILFDIGDVQGFPSKKILRTTHVFVSHTHMDHFVGFDYLLRVCLGRKRTIHVYGPSGLTDRVERKLGAYTWNLVENYEDDFVVVAHDAEPPDRMTGARFRCSERFRREPLEPEIIADGVLLEEDALRVRTTLVDHSVPCLAFCFEEKLHVNIWKDRLDELGLRAGPWLKDLKNAVVAGCPDEMSFRVPAPDTDGETFRELPLGELKETLVRIVPGQRIGYVTDLLRSGENLERIVNLVRGADQLFIEAFFLHGDVDRARRAFHLTAREAGALARAAGVTRVFPMHVSPRYNGRLQEILAEVRDAFRGNVLPM